MEESTRKGCMWTVIFSGLVFLFLIAWAIIADLYKYGYLSFD